VPLRMVLSILCSFLVATIAVPPAQAEEDPRMQILFLGAAPERGAPGPLPRELPVIAIDALPEADAAQQEVFAARLRANPVSTFVSTPDENAAQFEQFYLVTDLTLTATAEGVRFALNGEAYAPDAFATRVGALVEAFDPRHRRIAFIRIADPEDALPMTMAPVQDALTALGFDMTVAMVGPSTVAAGCDGPTALHYAVVSGLADRAPFGDADGVSTAAEVQGFLRSSLNRRIARAPECGPRYSLILKSSDDPSVPIVADPGKSAFPEMETQLYHETFEAMFLLESDERDSVQAFLESCEYCPNEAALTDRLRQMSEFERASALEAEIWDRIKSDEDDGRLAIYLENCTLCAYREAAEARIAEIDAKKRAAAQEAADFTAARDARDLPALRAYVAECIACAYRDEAADLVAEIEADEVYQAEQVQLASVLASQDPAMMRAYLDECEICNGAEEVQAAIVVEAKRQRLRAPCLALAAVPQLGGPRKLDAIDQDQARATCEAAAQEFPEDGLIRTTLGRIAQAAGDFETAKASYVFGMEDDVPSAYGLAAYSYYAPPDDGEIDLDRADELARAGAEMGDWLSKEILTVIYSKALVPGKTAEDAFRIAEDIALEGNALAQFFVGYYYLTGTGVELSEQDAVTWLKKSVDQGYTHAYSFLAELIEQGRGIEQSIERAAELYWAALEKGDATALERLTTQLGNRNREVIRLIQQRLREAEVYRGQLDGIAGPSTVAAVRSFAESLTTEPS